MILKKLYLENFRGYEKITIPFNNNLNVIIGKNDVGKSTILEALEIFFNNETVKIEIEDLRVGAVPRIVIGVAFQIDKSKEYLIDPERKTSLEAEYLLNEDGLLEIRKIWDCTKSLTAKSLTSYIVANYLKEFSEEPLVALKITDLKKICTAKGLDANVQDKRVLSDFRKAIYNSIQNKEKQLTLIPIDKEDIKRIYDSISSEFPYFAIFQSDRQNRDSDKEVQDPLKVITKQAIAEVEVQLKSVVEEIERRAIEKGKRTIEKLSEMNPEIAKTLYPNVKNKNWDTLFSFSFTGDEGIPINKRGSGVRRLILLNYFRAEAEERVGSSKGVIYALEEPETSQHPEYQKILIDSLIKLANDENRQVIITTHSPEIAKIAENESLILIKKDSLGKPNIVSEENNKLSDIRETLGIMPYLTKLVVCVEGEYDIRFLKNINQNIPELKSIIDLEEKQISIIPMIGGNLKNWVERYYLKDSNVIEFHIYDRDSSSGKNTEQYKEQAEKINSRPDKSFAVLTKKRELENYIPKEIYSEYFKAVDCNSISDWDNEDLPTFFASKTGLKQGEVKSIVNGCLAKRLTKEMLVQLDAFEEIKGWFEKISELYE
ncbi:ATP-binding protein [Butyricimonas sp. Marseille-P3923]|uniref:ATP-binding protein n=1 Tax=Butyricimonas sp. Marseille-P3923 TaxID=1987504 RepID=UPI000C087676|nr:ATP-binding protein [Butyricimonas sp. Marseille-P3923]